MKFRKIWVIALTAAAFAARANAAQDCDASYCYTHLSDVDTGSLVIMKTDATSGRIIWSRKFQDLQPDSTRLIQSGQKYIYATAKEDGSVRIVGLSKKDGVLKWASQQQIVHPEKVVFRERAVYLLGCSGVSCHPGAEITIEKVSLGAGEHLWTLGTGVAYSSEVELSLDDLTVSQNSMSFSLSTPEHQWSFLLDDLMGRILQKRIIR